MTDRERLDEKTEGLIFDAISAGRRGQTEDAMIDAHVALRERIKELVEEARNTGEPPKAWSGR